MLGGLVDEERVFRDTDQQVYGVVQGSLQAKRKRQHKTDGMEFNGRVWKEPRGFIKILELVFGIWAFASTSSFSSLVSVIYTCGSDLAKKSLDLHFSYPFDLSAVRVPHDPCNQTLAGSFPLSGSYASSAEFFVAIGVLTFLYCLAALLIYIFLDRLYHSHDNITNVDFIITVSLAFLWLVASSAWAHGIGGVKYATDADHVAELLNKPKDNRPACTSCVAGLSPNYANLNISVILGFLNCFIWCGNVWFLWKETAWYRARYPNEGGPPMGGSSSGPLPGMDPSRI